MLVLADERLRRLRKRILKPLLAPALAGEPWKPALSGVAGTFDPGLVAACVVSYASRRDAAWSVREAGDLLKLVQDLVAADCESIGRDRWPFVHALARMLEATDRGAVARLVGVYQRRYQEGIHGESTTA